MALKAEVTRGPYDPGGQPETNSGQPMEFGLFAWNIKGGATGSKAVLSNPDRYQDYWKWPIASHLIQEADRVGFDYQVPFARWIGQGGPTEWNDASIDFLTSAAASAPITKDLLLFSTAHCTYNFHPLHFAKFGASIDNISGGRWGLNLVAGYSAREFAAFGHLDPMESDEAYARADEFTTLMKWLWTADEPIDFEGEFYQAYGAYVNPRPTRKPRPLLMSAGQSDNGLDFACRHVDWLFAIQPTMQGYADLVSKVNTLASSYNRKVKVATQTWVVMDATESKARATVDWIAEEVDKVATMNFITSSQRQSVSKTFGWKPSENADDDPWGGIGKEKFLKMALGIGAHHLVGSYESVAEEIRELHEAGVESCLMSYFDPLLGIHQMEDHVFPILKKMGLRKS